MIESFHELLQTPAFKVVFQIMYLLGGFIWLALLMWYIEQAEIVRTYINKRRKNK